MRSDIDFVFLLKTIFDDIIVLFQTIMFNKGIE